jgi:DNA-binding transcriptional LysR family regulator
MNFIYDNMLQNCIQLPIITTQLAIITTGKVMDWNSMKIFLAIADSGNLTNASKTLSLSHSTVFRRLNTFEDNIGGRLFDRNDGKYELTELGEEFLKLANPIAHSFDDIERYLIGKDMKPHGTVRITAPTSFAYNYFPKYLKDFNKLYPDIKVELLVSDQEMNMTTRIADIAIRVTSSPPESLVGRTVQEIQWAIYGSKKYISKNGRPKDLRDLSTHLLIGPSNSLKALSPFSWMEKKYNKNIVLRSDDLVTMSHLAGNDLGLAILPDDLKHSKIERIFTFKTATPNKLWILTHPDLRRVERIKIAMSFFSEVLSTEII